MFWSQFNFLNQFNGPVLKEIDAYRKEYKEDVRTRQVLGNLRSLEYLSILFKSAGADLQSAPAVASFYAYTNERGWTNHRYNSRCTQICIS